MKGLVKILRFKKMKILIKHILLYVDMFILFDCLFVKNLHYVKGGGRGIEGMCSK